MDYKKILKLSLATFVMTVFLFLLSFKVVMFIVKKEINSLLDNKEIEKKSYSLTIDNKEKCS